MRAVLSEFYSHPWAWNEIGYGGPAYPRGYMRLGATGPARALRGARRRPSEDPVSDVASEGAWRGDSGAAQGRARARDNDSRFLLDAHRRGLPARR